MYPFKKISLNDSQLFRTVAQNTYDSRYDAIAGNSIIAVKLKNIVKYHDCDIFIFRYLI